MKISNRSRQANIIRILEALWFSSRKSRADIARELHLDRSTVGMLVDQMIEKAVIREFRDTESGPRGGRPPVLLEICSGIAYSIGVELTYPNVRLVAVDFSGEFIGETLFPVESYGPQAVDKLVKEIKFFRQNIDAEFGRGGAGLVTIGVGVSGQVDDSGTAVLISHALHISEPLFITTALENGVDVPVSMLNDAQAAALREAGVRRIEDILLIFVELRPGNSMEDIGIGAGLVIRNHLCSGKTVTHLLRTQFNPVLNGEAFDAGELGRSLALVANVTGIDQIVLGGDVDDIIEPLKIAVAEFTRVGRSEPEKSVQVSQITGGRNAVALSAAYSAMKLILHEQTFPLQDIFTST